MDSRHLPKEILIEEGRVIIDVSGWSGRDIDILLEAILRSIRERERFIAFSERAGDKD